MFRFKDIFTSPPSIKYNNFNMLFDAIYWTLFVPPSEEERQTNGISQEEENFHQYFKNIDIITQQPRYRPSISSKKSLRRAQYLEIKQEMDSIRQRYSISENDKLCNPLNDTNACKELVALLAVYQYVIWQEQAQQTPSGNNGGIAINKQGIVEINYNTIAEFGKHIARLRSMTAFTITSAQLQFHYDRYLEKRILTFCHELESIYPTQKNHIINFTNITLQNADINKQSDSCKRLTSRLTLLAFTATSALDMVVSQHTRRIKDKKPSILSAKQKELFTQKGNQIYVAYQDSQRVLLHLSKVFENYDPNSKAEIILKTTYGYWDKKGKLYAALNKLYYRLHLAILEMQSKKPDPDEKTFLQRFQDLDLLQTTLNDWFNPSLQNNVSSNETALNTVITTAARIIFNLVISNTIYKIKEDIDKNGNIDLILRMEDEATLTKFYNDLPKDKQLRTNVANIFNPINELAKFIAKLHYGLEKINAFLFKHQKGEFTVEHGHTWKKQLQESVDALLRQLTAYHSIYTINDDMTVILQDHFQRQLITYLICLVNYKKNPITTDKDIAAEACALISTQLNTLLHSSIAHTALKPLLKATIDEYCVVSTSITLSYKLDHMGCSDKSLATYQSVIDQMRPLLINRNERNTDFVNKLCWCDFYTQITTILKNANLGNEDKFCDFVTQYLELWQTKLMAQFDTTAISNSNRYSTLSNKSNFLELLHSDLLNSPYDLKYSPVSNTAAGSFEGKSPQYSVYLVIAATFFYHLLPNGNNNSQTMVQPSPNDSINFS
ncbi:MAG: hypothetical protein ACK4PR_04830 [Gammaproteobacteria bacterium]